MDSSQTFEQFLSTQTPPIDLLEFASNLLLTAVIASILSFIYIRFGNTISNRRMFAINLVIISMTTMLIITVVKSSLALSLGLVGALSIVRFRTPIKEPEELSYLFLSIAVGLGLGAGQRAVVLVGFIFIAGYIWLRFANKRKGDEHGMHLTVTAGKAMDGLLDRVIDVLKTHAATVKLRRVDEGSEGMQADFFVFFEDYSQLSAAKKNLMNIDADLHVSLMDNRIL